MKVAGRLVRFSAALLAAAGFTPARATAASCEDLAALALPATTITRAQSVAAGEFSLPGTGPTPGAAQAAFQDLAAFCRVAATLKPSADSDIKIEVWMPASGWNGKFQAVGNGGWAGTISYAAMSRALRRGYATASTDTGHTGDGGSFALGHPEKLIDFGHRAVHETTVQAKAIITAFYGSGPRLSYWNGCSTGGRQALMEAQRFPRDYDGIIAGAPANFRTHLVMAALWVAQATLREPASYIPPSKYPLIHQAVLEACDALDGVKDGVLEDPTRCRFDPKMLQCKGSDAPTCLTAPQVEAARKIYAPVTNPRTGKEIFPGMAPGSELGWAGMAAGPEPRAVATDHFKYVVFQDPKWNWRKFNFDSDVALTDRLDNGAINATDPNLERFFGHGGKLLMYHGWSDQLIAPRNSINYYQSVVRAMGGASKVQDSIRLFMAPGMGHCGGGEGPNTLDAVSALEQWIEKGKAPDQILASHSTGGKADRTRPLCPHPQVARWKGSGSTDDAVNFVCAPGGER